MHYRWRLRRRGRLKTVHNGMETPYSLRQCPLHRAFVRCAPLNFKRRTPSTPLKGSLLNAGQKLQQAGFVSVRDVKGTRGPINLAREAGLTNAEASDVLKTLRFGIQGTSLAGARSASEILYEENCKLAIFTFSKDLDDLLGGGIAVGEITELCGCPGIGKTQACIQLCVSVQMPKAFGGYEGSAVYIDTEGSFMAERAREMARATVGHLFSISRFLPKQPSGSDPLAQFTEEAILDRFHLFRCHEITELLAVVESLPTYVKAHGVKLVVIDSIAFHFRQDFKDMALRTAILAKMTSQLLNLAKSEQLAVVSVNQVTVKPDLASGVARLVPALGESYAHGCTTRVILRWERDVRMAYLYKSPRLPRGKARFTVTNGGLRDVRGKKRQAE
mmetsp:Transcript_9562/g.43545  ORF Transcript_9562/g.43545 Transcript_9562/m.43545 type:complete len:389 (+) Transcript_9562:130-1296(+)